MIELTVQYQHLANERLQVRAGTTSFRPAQEPQRLRPDGRGVRQPARMRKPLDGRGGAGVLSPHEDTLPVPVRIA